MTFPEFLKSLEADTYPEPPSAGHDAITADVLPGVVARVAASKTDVGEPLSVLDVGCGQGVALMHFAKADCRAHGITTNEVDYHACLKLTRENLAWCFAKMVAHKQDMHDIGFADEQFDLIWARHVLEHSPAPLFALHEFKRVLRPGGWLYIEVPMPMTACRHETNQNHYSVLTCSMWQSLIQKAGFTLVEGKVIPLNTQAGPDEYRSYLCRK